MEISFIEDTVIIEAPSKVKETYGVVDHVSITKGDKKYITVDHPFSDHNQKILDSLKNNLIPDFAPYFSTTYHNNTWHMRDIITQNYNMWLYVDQPYAKRLAKWLNGRSVLDPFAGRGWLAKALSDEGVHVNAGDIEAQPKSVFDVKEISAEDLAKESKEDIMILSWVPYGYHAFDVSENWGKDRPILFLGELGDCCSTEEYSNHVREFKSLKYEDDLRPYNWSGIHDSATSYMWEKEYDPYKMDEA